MDMLTAIIAGFGLAAPAGLNAWLPLFIVGLAARFTNLVHLNEPYNLLTNEWVLITLGVLLAMTSADRGGHAAAADLCQLSMAYMATLPAWRHVDLSPSLSSADTVVDLTTYRPYHSH